MNVFGWVLLAAAAVAAVADWVAVARRAAGVEQLAKPAVPVLLALWAVLAHAEATVPGRWLLLALLAWLVGDVLLLAPDRFTPGALAFLVGHVAVLLGVLALPARTAWWPAVLLVVALGAVAVVAVRRRAVASEPAVAGLATAYGVVLVLVAAATWWRGAVLPAAGLTLLAVSDLLLAGARFAVVPRAGRALPVAVMVTYHGAAALVTVGLVRPDLVG
ncbi:lysoplasmalogenase family protein [Lapillicoccus jejuensis]|uniref:YhhN-like protein n=1 Tax=Lapillicoccus jejuensis TaxID=402171 RepID=A0A542DVX0_9MICO|nr:lysoplasmalogenase family protein [Lapillicoccus jejuensis]TQJ07054.1 YhhN-like protein [Lapillicoccus jejuensis]